MGRDIAQKGCRRITMLRVPERAWLPLMQFPKDEPEQAAERQGRGKENPRFRQANQRDEDNAKGNDKSDRMTCKAHGSIFYERHNIFGMEFVFAGSSRGYKCVGVLTGGPDCSAVVSGLISPLATNGR